MAEAANLLKVGRYDIVYPVAHGGMAGVYVGRLPGMAGFEKLVAIKVIHPHLAQERSFIDMFLDEARLAARIHHPNVGEIYEIGTEDDMYFMVQELVLGQNLHLVGRALSKKSTTIPEAISAYIVAQVCLGLHEAHQQKAENGKLLGLVHRDVTPRNILVSYNGYVKLVDFGVAWARDRLSHTEVGTVKGKIGFMAPEQIRCEPLDRRCDIFSLGVVLYMLLTGKHPFSAGNDAATIASIMAGKPTLPREINPGIPAELEEIVMTALAHSPSDRYPTAARMNKALEHFIQSTDLKTGPDSLSRLMHSLFEKEVQEHEDRLRAHRREKGEQTGGISIPSTANEVVPDDEGAKDTLPQEPSVKPVEEGTSVATPSALKARCEEGSDNALYIEPESSSISVSYTQGEYAIGSSRRVRLLAAVGLVVVVAVGLIIFWKVISPSVDNPEPVASIQDDIPVVTPEDKPIPKPEPAPALPSEITIRLEDLPDGALVKLDDKIMEHPIVVPRSSVSVALVVSATGYVPYKETLRPDRDLEVSVHMKRQAPATMSEVSEKSPAPEKQGANAVQPKPVQKKRVKPKKKKEKILVDNPFD